MDETKNKIQTHKVAYIYVVTAAILWGIIGIFVKKLNVFGVSTLQSVFIRAFVAAIFMFIFIMFKYKKVEKISLYDFKYFIGTGLFSFVFFNGCYFIAIEKTSLSVAAILLYTAPTFVVILAAILFKEKMASKKIISLCLTFIGCIFVTFSNQGVGNNVNLIGVLAGLGAGIGYALYSIIGMYALMKYDSVTVTFYTFIFASLGLLPFINLKEFFILFLNFELLIYSILLGLISTAIPFLLYTNGLTKIEPSKASIIATLEPIVATIIGIILFKEPVTLFKILGISIVIIGLFNLREKE